MFRAASARMTPHAFSSEISVDSRYMPTFIEQWSLLFAIHTRSISTEFSSSKAALGIGRSFIAKPHLAVGTKIPRCCHLFGATSLRLLSKPSLPPPSFIPFCSLYCLPCGLLLVRAAPFCRDHLTYREHDYRGRPSSQCSLSLRMKSCVDKAYQAPATNSLDSVATNPNERLPLHPFDLHPLEHSGLWEHHRDSSETCRSLACISPLHLQLKEFLETHPDLILDRLPMN